MSTADIEARAHEIARTMPDMFPFGYAMYLASEEALEEIKIPQGPIKGRPPIGPDPYGDLT